jgi:tetratricopeptide (TPR) repeat protein
MRNKNKRILKRFLILCTLFGVVLVAGVALHIARNKGKERLLREHHEAGFAAYEAGNFEEAVEKLGYYNSAINDDPDVAYKLADASRRLPSQGGNGLRKAVSLAKTAADLAPTRTEPLELLLDLHGELNQQTERLSVALKLLRLEENSPAALTAKAMAEVALGRRTDALETANLLAEVTPNDPESHKLVFAILAREDAAVGRQMMSEYAEKIGEEHPDDPRFVVLRVHASALMGSYEDARKIAVSLIDADLDEETLGEAMRALDLLGMRDECDSLLARHADRPELFQFTSLLSVKRAFMRGHIDEARQIAELSLRSDPMPSMDIVPWALACGVELSAEQIKLLFDHSEKSTVFQQTLVDGFDAINAGDPLAALDSFSRAQSMRRDDPLAGALLADAQDRIGAWKDAARERKDVLRRTPEFTTVRLSYIESLLNRGNPVEADAAIREGLEIDNSNGALLLAHVLAVADMSSNGVALPEEIRGGIRVAEALEADATTLTPASVPLARMLVAIDNQSKLNQVLDRIVDADPDSIDLRALLSLANTLNKSGHHRTEQIFEMIDSSSQVDPYVLLERATAMADDGRAEEGLGLLNRKLDEMNQVSAQAGLMMQMARAVYLDRTADPSAALTLQDLASGNPANPAVQTLVLESRTAWSNPQMISESVSRLKAITGDASSGWRIHEARRMLTFDPTKQIAASVVSLLSDTANSSNPDPVSQLVLADAMAILGDTSAAADYLESAIDAGFDSPSLVLKLIAIRQSMGEIDSARRRAISLAQIEPVNNLIRRERVAALVRLGIFEAARSDGERLAQSESPRDLLIAANLAGRLGDTDASAARLDKLISLDEIPDDVLIAATLTLVDAERVSDAFRLLENNRSDSPSRAFDIAEATLLERTGQDAQAIRALDRAIERSANVELYTAKARILARQGKAVEAKAVCQSGLASSPGNQELKLLLEAIDLVSAESSVNLTSGENDASRKVVDAIRKFSVETSDQQGLIERMRSITTESPSYYAGWSVLVTQLQSAGRFEEAAESAQTAMRLIPSDPRPARLAVDAMLLTNEPRKALAAAQEWSRRSKPESYQADTTLAALHARLGSNNNALRALEPWVNRISSDNNASPILVRLLATVRILNGDTDEAWQLISHRIKGDSRWLASAIEISRDLIERGGSTDAAAVWLDRVISEWDADAEDTLRIAQAQLDIATRTGSESDLLSVLESLDSLASMPNQSRSITRGASLLRIAAERLLGRTADAAQHARALVASMPGDSVAQSMMALTIIESGGNADQAVTAATKAIEFAEQNPQGLFELTTALNALGQSQMAAGNPGEAESSFRRVLGLLASSTSSRLGLAEALFAQGRAGEAARIARDPSLRRSISQRPGLQARYDRLNAAIQDAG